MSYHTERYHRAKSAGGTFPDAHENMQSLRRVFQSSISNTSLLVWFFLWITNQLSNVNSKGKLPEFYRLKLGEPAKNNALRAVYDGTISWVEYSVPIIDSDRYTWLPAPASINKLLHAILVRHENYDKPLLKSSDKKQLLDFITKRQKPPYHMQAVKMANKRIFEQYFDRMQSATVNFPISARQLIFAGATVHHNSSGAYQQHELSELTHIIYRFNCDALKRLLSAAENEKISDAFTRTVHGEKCGYKLNQAPAKYLTQHKNHIISLTKVEGCPTKTGRKTHRLIEQKNQPRIGGKYALTQNELKLCFNALNEYLNTKNPDSAPTRENLLEYYNAMTYVLACQTIVLTSLRPTHQITFSRYDFSPPTCMVRDKGQLREIYICDFLARQYQVYLELQKNLKPYGSMPEQMLFLLSEEYQPQFLSAKKLSQFLEPHWPNHIPYQLRHGCSQILSELGTPSHLIDIILGHVRHGEQAGHAEQTHMTQKMIIARLDLVAQRLQLGGF